MKPHRAMKRAAEKRPRHAFTRFGLLMALQSVIEDHKAEDAARIAKGEPAIWGAKIAELTARLELVGGEAADPERLFDVID